MLFKTASLTSARLTTCGAALLALASAACAHAPSSSPNAAAPAKRAVTAVFDGAGGERSLHIKRPESRLEARGMLERAFEASADGHHNVAVQLYGAVLATDYLTDKGRANLYWMRAESFGEMRQEDGRRDALAGFLVASDLPPADEDLTARRLLARSALTAMRVEEDPGFGRSPETPISVEDLREPASIISSLSCGESRDAHYVDVAIRSVRREQSRLVHRRAECERDGAVLDLWFDVTNADRQR